MTKIPIISEKIVKTTHKVIEWSLHNVCNYDCSYCGEENKIGDLRWKPISTYKLYIDKLIRASGSNVWFLITGGEPTLYPNFIELITYLKSKGAYIGLISNGSRTLRWWEECKQANAIDSLYISCHTEKIKDYEHIASVLNIFHDSTTKTNCFIISTPETIGQVVDSVNFLEENTASKIEVKFMNIAKYNIFSNITPDQLAFMSKIYYGKKPNKVNSNIPLINHYENKIRISYDDGSVVDFNGSQDLIKADQNHFLGWHCNINNDALTVNVNLCRRGQTNGCELSPIVADLEVDEVEFINEYVVCPYESCHCSANLYAHKYKTIAT